MSHLDRMPMNRPTTTSTLVILVLGSVTLLALRMFEFTFSGAGLHVDEAQYWLWSRDLQWGYFSKPPVLVALIKVSTALFGNSLLGVKALAMTCWILSAWVLGRLAYRISGMRTAIFCGRAFFGHPGIGLVGPERHHRCPPHLVLGPLHAHPLGGRACQRPTCHLVVDRMWFELGAGRVVKIQRLGLGHFRPVGLGHGTANAATPDFFRWFARQLRCRVGFAAAPILEHGQPLAHSATHP